MITYVYTVNGAANATFPWFYLDPNNFYINSTLGSDVGVYIFVTTWTTIDIHGVTVTASGTFTATIVCKLSSVSPVNVLPNSYTYFIGSPMYFLNLWRSFFGRSPLCGSNSKPVNLL